MFTTALLKINKFRTKTVVYYFNAVLYFQSKMKTTTPEKLAELQRTPRNIRNICILAHVDHGKLILKPV